MSKYFYQIIKTKTGYFFALYPNNSKKIPIGQSSEFSSEANAKEGLYQFQQFIKKNRNSLSTHIEISKKDSLFYGSLNFEEGCFFREKGYCHKYEYIDWLQRIEKNIDTEIKIH